MPELPRHADRRGDHLIVCGDGPLSYRITEELTSRYGERVTVTPARCYWPGDVVAFQTAQGRIAVHRLLGYRLVAGRLAWVTRGDRCASPDPPPGRERWLGRAAVPPTALERARALLALLGLGWRAARRRLAR